MENSCSSNADITLPVYLRQMWRVPLALDECSSRSRLLAPAVSLILEGNVNLKAPFKLNTVNQGLR